MSLTTTENRRLEALFESLKMFESVGKALQCDKTKLSDVRAIVDEIIDDHPDRAQRLSSTANIVQCSWFESAIVKIQRGNVSALSREENSKLKGFVVGGASECLEKDSQLSFVKRALKCQKISHQAQTDKYVDTRDSLAISNICEMLLSRVEYLLNERRKGLTLANLEAQIFLYMNIDLWDVQTINGL